VVADLDRFAQRLLETAHAGVSVRCFSDGLVDLRIDGSLETQGRLRGVEGYQLREADRLEVVETQKRLDFDFRLRERESLALEGQQGTYRYEFLDESGFRFELEPADAPFELSLRADGHAFPLPWLFLGANAVHPGALPLRLAGTDRRLARSDYTLPSNVSSELGLPAYCLVWRGASASVTDRADLSPEIEARLKALGYLRD